MTSRYTNRRDNEWFPLRAQHNGQLIQCCDCGLVHQMRYRRRKNRRGFDISFARMKRHTASVRAALARRKTINI